MRKDILKALARYFVYSALVSAAFKVGGEEGIDYLHCFVGGDEVGRQSEYVGVIVAACEFCKRCVPAEGCTYALVVVAGHGDAVAGGADGDTEVVFAFLHSRCHGVGEVGIVATLGGVAAKVVESGALLFEAGDDVLLEVVACVVAAKSDTERGKRKHSVYE